MYIKYVHLSIRTHRHLRELSWMICLVEQRSTQMAQTVLPSSSNSKYFYHYCHWETLLIARWRDRAWRLHQLPFPTDCVADHALCPTHWSTSFLLGKPQTELSLAVFAFLTTHSWFFFPHYHFLNISQHIIYFSPPLQDLCMPFFHCTMNHWLKYLDFQKNTIIQYTSNLLSQCANKVERGIC